jgi:hypothetical protein
VKILAKFLLSTVLVFLPALCCAQDDYFVPQKNCALPTLANTTKVEELADKQDCINGNQIQLKTSVENLRFRMRSNETNLLVLEDKLKLDLRTAETKIATLEASLRLIERRLSMAEDEIEWLTPKAPASKLKAPVSKPTSGFIPDTPSTTPHPTSKKSDVSKPKAPVNTPTPQ